MRPAQRLALAVVVNSASVATEGWCGAWTRVFGHRAWLVHALLILPPWVWFLRSLARVPPRRSASPAPAAAGLIGEAGGLGLVVVGFRRLGLAAAVNGDLFGLMPRKPDPRPVLGVIRDPVYTGYTAWLAGWALRTGRLRLLPVAAEMLVLLTLEARIEDWAARPKK
ncbi:MAG TPA: methyltransferase [Candidatus Dormibacteraeota bacterium]|nr:methyltransferase [Candidatus Dormibacteraeota bacterium]